MKKTLTALLLLSALLFCACSETAENPEDPGTAGPGISEDGSPAAETAPPETEIDAADRVPEMKFEKEMHFLLPDVSWLTRDIITDEITGERVNDAQNSMKLAMEERFGTTLSETFTGDIIQVPPAYSAIKIHGRKAYDMARNGEEVKLEGRHVTIHSFDFIEYAPPEPALYAIRA